MIKKTISLAKAVEQIQEGSTLMVGGFMGVGTPGLLIDELVRQRKGGLTLISSDTARPGIGVGKLIDAGLVEQVVTSHIGTNPETQRRLLTGELKVELVPQGSLAERVRCAGYGLGGVLTATGLGTLASEGKRTLEIDGHHYLLELPLKADFALVKAQLCDYSGNLRYRLTAQNFNPLMAMAAQITLVEAGEVVPVGCIGPDNVHTPGALVDFIIARESAL